MVRWLISVIGWNHKYCGEDEYFLRKPIKVDKNLASN